MPALPGGSDHVLRHAIGEKDKRHIQIVLTLMQM